MCRVVDNFGDAGVCWRLARQLAAEQHGRVVLFIDRPELIRRLSGGAAAPPGVGVRDWPDEAPDFGAAGIDDPDVVVSAFGCELPSWLRTRLAGGPRRPMWINLEYLSAEAWVDGCHGLASVKPQDCAVEHFFYPGFGAATGGLLRERDAVAPGPPPVDDSRAQALQALCGLHPEPGERVISLFCYPDAPLDAWLQALSDGTRPSLLAVPEGVADAALARFVGAELPTGAPALRRGKLRLARIPFLQQQRYDELLTLCDLNFVRGEDSWVRAHWARRPFVWQPYRQDDGADRVKLDAFLTRFAAVAGRREPTPAAIEAVEAVELVEAVEAVEAMMRAWSGGEDVVTAWRRFETRLDELGPFFERWTDSLLEQPDLASNLVNWARRKL